LVTIETTSFFAHLDVRSERFNDGILADFTTTPERRKRSVCTWNYCCRGLPYMYW